MCLFLYLLILTLNAVFRSYPNYLRRLRNCVNPTPRVLSKRRVLVESVYPQWCVLTLQMKIRPDKEPAGGLKLVSRMDSAPAIRGSERPR